MPTYNKNRRAVVVEVQPTYFLHIEAAILGWYEMGHDGKIKNALIIIIIIIIIIYKLCLRLPTKGQLLATAFRYLK